MIKQVAKDLEKSFNKLKTFITLSPVPGFMEWLETKEPKLYKKYNKKLNIQMLEKNKKLLYKHQVDCLMMRSTRW